MNSLPYYKRFPRDLLEGTAGMPFEEKAAYALLLDLIYLHNGRLADDPRFIGGHLGLSVRKWKTIRAALVERGKIEAKDGIISNFRADKELEIQRKYRDQKAENRRGLNENNELDERPSTKRANNQNQNQIEANASIPPKAPREPDRFPEFWDAYDHKRAKGAAEKAWAKASRQADPSQIIAAARAYAGVRDPNFVKNAATWLNAGCWEDDLSTYQRKENRNEQRPRPAPSGFGGAADQQSRVRAFFTGEAPEPESGRGDDQPGPFGGPSERGAGGGSHHVWPETLFHRATH